MNFDIAIIGGGPAGYTAAERAGANGLKAVLFEKKAMGGVCLNEGCIPTKTLLYSAKILDSIKSASKYGVSAESPSFDLSKIMSRKDKTVKMLTGGVKMTVNSYGVTIVEKEAFIEGEKEGMIRITCDGETYSVKYLLVCTGSDTVIPPIPGLSGVSYWTSKEALEIKELPKTLVIIGGGVIGMEFASIFNGLGTDVTVVEYAREILPPFDKDIAKRLRTTLKQRGITFCTGAEVTAIELAEGVVKRVVFNEKGKQKTVESEIVLMAVGRKAVVPQGAAEVGYAIGRRGFEVDGAFRTNIDGVRAVGDCNGICQLAHAASAQARVAMGENVDMSVIPSAVFTMPECAMVGRTEEQCLAAGIDITTGKAFFRANGKANAMGHTDGMVKLIINNSTHLIEGCHICGPHASDLIAEAALAMSSRLPAETLAACIHAHPTLSEALLSALPHLPS